MTIGENLGYLALIAIVVVNLVCLLVVLLALAMIFFSDSNEQRLFGIIMSIAFFAFGLPVISSMSPTIKNAGFPAMVIVGDFYFLSFIALATAMFVSQCIMITIHLLTGFFDPSESAPPNKLQDLVTNIMIVGGGFSLGFYLANFSGGVIGFIVGIVSLIIDDIMTHRSLAVTNPPPQNQGRATIEGSVQSEVPPLTEPPSPSLKGPTGSIADGFDVPPQR